MKKFEFTLQALLGIKQSLEKQQKAELLEVEQRLAEARRRLYDLYDEFERRRQEYADIASKGTDVPTLNAHGQYFDLLRDHIAQQELVVEQIQQEKEVIQQALWLTMREIKTLENLREKQYEEYMIEVRREEEKDINDLVSYRSSQN